MKEVQRSNVAGVRKSLATLGAIVAEVDRQLRYVWIDNPHPDFQPEAVIGKRDDELLAEADAREIMALKQETLARHAAIARLLTFKRTERMRCYSLFSYPIRESSGRVDAILTVGFDVPPP